MKMRYTIESKHVRPVLPPTRLWYHKLEQLESLLAPALPEGRWDIPQKDLPLQENTRGRKQKTILKVNPGGGNRLDLDRRWDFPGKYVGEAAARTTIVPRARREVKIPCSMCNGKAVQRPREGEEARHAGTKDDEVVLCLRRAQTLTPNLLFL